MGMPSVTISFTELASSSIQRGERGIVCLILKDTVPSENPFTCTSESDIPTTLTTANQEQIALALKGYVTAPYKVVVYVLDSEATSYSDAFTALETVKFDYLVVPTVATDALESSVASQIASWRSDNKLVKAVLPNYAADSEGIIDFATTNVYVDDTEYTTEQYCSRIAGIICGTPLSISCTYAPLTELTDCTRLTKDDMDAAVEAGKLIVWWDGEKVKVARGVNSLVTTTSEKGSQFQKIKIVDAMDIIANDIRLTAEDNYLGKYPNTYDNKCLLISAIGNYFDGLVSENVLKSWTLDIDTDANATYLTSKGYDVTDMTDQEIKEANTGSYVYLKATLSILDAIEDITLAITI